MLQFYQYHTILTIQNYHKTVFEWFRSHAWDIDSVTTDQVRIKDHLSTQFV